MKKTVSILCALVLLTVALLGLAGCGSSKGKLVMATNATFPPYEFVDGDKIVGIDPEIAQLIADKIGMELEIVDVDFNGIVDGVQSGKYTMGMAGMTVTEDRKKSVDFTVSYATGVQVVIVKEGGSIASLDDLEGKKIGVQLSTTGDIYASDTPENGGYGEENVVKYKNGTDAVAALVADKVDCVIIDNEPAKAYVAANPGLTILDTEYVTEDYAICVSKNNGELLEKINTALQELIDDGSVKKIIDKYIKAD